jgi:hypothetical protein
MPKKDKQDSLMAAVMNGFKAAGIKDAAESVTTIAKYWEDMKWIDVYDPIKNRPCIAMEWLLGARGFPAGKVMQLRGSFSSSKSTFLYYVYGCAMRGSTMEDRKAWVAHIETEGAPNSADYIARFGCDPRLFLHIKTNDLNDMFRRIDTFDMALHGGRDGTVNPETGRLVKSKFSKEDALDPDMTKPTIVGIDSLSNVGSGAGEDFVDLDKSEKPGGDSKDVRRFFRAREQDYDRHQVTMFVTTHETTEIKTGGAGYGGPKSTARNQKALGMALTIAIETLDAEWKGGKDGKEVLGSRQFLKTFKSKIAPRNRKIVLYRKLLGGYDMAETDLQFFLGDPKNNNCTQNPFLPGGFLCPEGAKCGITKVRGGWSAPMVSDKVFKTADELIEAIYSDKDRLMKIREVLRIRGFGFPFETQYTVAVDVPEPGTENEDESAPESPDDENNQEETSEGEEQ